MHEDIDSFVLFTLPEGQLQPGQPRVYQLINVRVQSDNTAATLMSIEDTWNKFMPEQPFSYYFMDDMLDGLYQNEKTSGRIFGIFSILAVVIACIGLFGLSTYMAEQRTKEVGIRKVLGSTASKIVVLMSRDFAKLVAVAFLIAVPIAYYVMFKWLQSFSFRTSIQLWIFLLAGVVALVVAQFTVSFQALRAANTNPADSLRFE
jgi:putative ABC transport system permease protein